ncbi:hypothetical protein [Limosilactobacillus equigenerosi]|uniref:IrrE N-terminal-like domain-containing protein n=1 Tax=Limosilactobacillus equigenerosi DSM 18793 = JCM 14505 TaxID=1423742 RepID=A0A0R1ULD7_9LACO|nr:hypothetical protein [Limosilactobacillus equigenerosi]KRL92314.1 hypothetical protein FC21_GL000362 [Limosilactobacillus equigenerosi DSM 18793 = JCM 14505]
MKDLERIEDMYPELRFWLIDVPNPHYHGHIDGNDVYLNANHDDLDWLKTALHECSHWEFDNGDLSNRNEHRVLIAEKWANYAADHWPVGILG